MITIGKKSLTLTEKGELRKFGLIVGCIFLALGLSPILKGKDSNLFLIIPALILIFFALVLPNVLSPFYKVWMRLGRILGKINSFLILSMIFYFVFVPFGIIQRMFKKNSEKFAHKTGKDSYWIKKAASNSKSDMKRTF